MNIRLTIMLVFWTCSSIISNVYAAPPTAEAVMQAHHNNLDKLATLHVELAYVQEWTEAARKSYTKQAEQLEAAVKAFASGAEVPKELPASMTAEQFVTSLRQQAETSRLLARNERFEERYEFFVDGTDYQVRTLLSTTGPDKNWTFPDVPLTKSSLASDYALIRIFSRSNQRTPAAQIWAGKPRVDSASYAMVSSKHITDSQNLRLPPFMWALNARADSQHAYDLFFSAPPERYRVMGTEERDGRMLTVVDVAVPTGQQGGSVGADGQVETWQFANYFRAWLDLERGAVPVVLHVWPRKDGTDFEDVVTTSPYRIYTTTEIRQLDSGAYYPVVVVGEELNVDPDVPQPTAEEWSEIQQGKRPALPTVVHRRETWNCSTAESTFAHDDEFFILDFPDGQAFFDLDTQQVIGGLEPHEPVKAGEPAPPLSVARWLDKQDRSLHDFQGKVVVLDFWGLWCGACRNAVPGLKQLQEKYKDQPVVFISIHTAEYDGDALAKRIEDYVQQQDWNYLAAIDAGTMIENSQTSHAYGVEGFPTEVIIGADGVIVFNSAVAPEGMEGVFGKSQSQLTADDRVRIEAFEKKMFEEAGEQWPVAGGISQEEQMQLMARINVFYMSRRIDASLSQARK